MSSSSSSSSDSDRLAKRTSESMDEPSQQPTQPPQPQPQTQPPPSAQVWKQFGLGSEIGRSLFRLYGGPGAVRAAGNHYSTTNAARLGSAAAGTETAPRRPLPCEESRVVKRDPIPVVAVPRFRKPVPEGPPKVDLIPKRRGKSAIDSDLAQIEADIKYNGITSTKPRLRLGPAEKERLQRIFEEYGVEKPVKKPVSSSTNPSSSSTSNRFEEIYREILDRQEFLDGMRALGQGKDYEYRIHCEIQELIREMEGLSSSTSNSSSASSSSATRPAIKKK